jgi:hypothetical protein
MTVLCYTSPCEQGFLLSPLTLLPAQSPRHRPVPSSSQSNPCLQHSPRWTHGFFDSQSRFPRIDPPVFSSTCDEHALHFLGMRSLSGEWSGNSAGAVWCGGERWRRWRCVIAVFRIESHDARGFPGCTATERTIYPAIPP